jgi:hypothetical protein
MNRRTRRITAVLVAMAALGSVHVPSVSARSAWIPFGAAQGVLAPFESRLDVASITFVNPERLRYQVTGSAPRARVYVEGECRRPDGTWSKRREKNEVVTLPFTENVTSLFGPSKFEYCWVWVTAFPRTKKNDPVTLSIVLEARYGDD